MGVIIMKKILKVMLTIFAFIFIVGSIIPYLIPVKNMNNFSYKLPFSESELVEVEGVTIHYRKWIPESENILGKILFIHGLGGSTFSWRHNVDYFMDKGYVVVAVDLPGFGYSSKESEIDHSQKNRSKLIWAVVDDIELSLDEDIKDMNWSLVGHSMGGGTVTAMSIERPDRVYKGILVAGAVFENNPSYLSEIISFYPPFRRWGLVFFERFLDEKRISNFLGSAYGREPAEAEIKGYLEPLVYSPNNKYAFDVISTANNEDIGILDNLNVQLYGIWGGNDSWVPINQGERVKNLIPGFDLRIIDHAYHCPMETHYDEFNSMLLDMLED